MRRVSFAAVAAAILSCAAACGPSGNGDVCTTAPNRSTIDCAPSATGTGCLGRDLGYADDNVYGASCEAPREGDTSACATLYSCDVSGGTGQWEPVRGF